jgi:hypothetical protein
LSQAHSQVKLNYNGNLKQCHLTLVPTEKHVLSAVVLTLPPTLSFHLVVVLIDSFIACFHHLRRGSVGSAQQTVVVRFLSFFLSFYPFLLLV